MPSRLSSSQCTFLIAVAIVTVGAAWTSRARGEEPAAAKPLRASALDIVDEKGRVRLTLGEVDMGEKAGAYGCVWRDGPRRLGYFGAYPDGQQGLTFLDGDTGRPRVQVLVSPGGKTMVLLGDKDGDSRVSIAVDASGSAKVHLASGTEWVVPPK